MDPLDPLDELELRVFEATGCTDCAEHASEFIRRLINMQAITINEICEIDVTMEEE